MTRARTSVLTAFTVSSLITPGCHHRRDRPIEEKVFTHGRVASFEGKASTLAPLPPANVPQHPYMAANGRSAMHVDAYCSNTYDTAGVHGDDPEVLSDSLGMIGGECSTLNLDKEG